MLHKGSAKSQLDPFSDLRRWVQIGNRWEVTNGLGIALYFYDINNAVLESADDINANYIDKVDSLLGVLNNKAASAEISFAPQLPDNPLSGVVKLNLNTHVSQVIAIYNGETGALDADYTYGLERISVHDEDTTTF